MKKNLNEENTKNICIIGLGQIGSRHFQALLNCDFYVNILCVDLNDDSISKAKSLIPKKLSKYIKSVNYLNDIESLPKEIDLAILATSADIRIKVLHSLLNYSKTENIIFEKILFQNSSNFDEASAILRKAGTKSWVNCPRRSWPVYKELKDYIHGKEKVSLNLYGGKWGLACNSIHFIDLFEWLTESKVKKINSSALDPDICDNKREGFVEFSGKLEVSYDKRNKVTLISDKKNDDANFEINLSGPDFNIEIKESLGTFKLEDENKIVSKEFTLPYQSELTNLFAKEIIYRNTSVLPTFCESLNQHKPMIEAFHRHFEKITKKKVEYCPIT